MSRPAFHPARSRRRQRGDTLLVVLIFLLVCLMGLVVSMRGSIVTTQSVGSNLQRQKNLQMADVALAQVESLMVANSDATGQPLEFSVGSGSSQPAWWRDVFPAVSTVLPPDEPYWATCATTNANDATKRCYTFTVNNAGATAVTGGGQSYSAWAVVQPAGRKPDTDGCHLNSNNYTMASFYTIYIRVREISGATSATTETVYRLCTKNASAS